MNTNERLNPAAIANRLLKPWNLPKNTPRTVLSALGEIPGIRSRGALTTFRAAMWQLGF